jgi:hypothetical protein
MLKGEGDRRMERICPDCKSPMNEMVVKIEDAQTQTRGWECLKCENIEFDSKDGMKVVEELQKKDILSFEQKISTFNENQICVPLNEKIINLLNIKPGMKVHMEVPDNHHLLITIP